MNAQDLKNSILQLAIQGKLVEQREEEGTAKELLERIETEKKQLIKEGKIKKQKVLPAIQEDEIPFDIPENWEWVRLGEITHNWGQKKPDQIFDYIDVRSIDNLNGVLSDSENLIKPEKAPSRARKIVKEGSVLYSTVRPYLLNICTVDKEFAHEPIASTAFAILHPFRGVNNSFLYQILRSPMFTSYVSSTMIGVAYPAINDTNLLKGLIPIPPLEEQKRIVEKIEELMPYVEKYDVAYSEVEELNKKFPEDMQKSILQYAIQGKLVEQRGEDGTAEELYKQIQEEKKRLIKEGKIKKTKVLPEITEEEIPFDIPENWKWVRLSDVSENIHYGYTASAKEAGNCKFLRITDIQNNSVDWESVPFCDVKDKDYGTYGLNNRDIMIARTGGTIGKTYIVDSLKDRTVFASYLIRVVPVEKINETFLKKFMESPLYWLQLKAGSMGTGQPNVNGTTLSKLLLPLPPLEEQKRIVAKIEELLPYAKQLVK